ncbi:hypothetical protein BZA77DRAFT_249678 [Pyronema omphalodes]|nr:hypothetical protein BZA77DRAFT_249678 [Pyronema omphalodes]
MQPHHSQGQHLAPPQHHDYAAAHYTYIDSPAFPQDQYGLRNSQGPQIPTQLQPLPNNYLGMSQPWGNPLTQAQQQQPVSATHSYQNIPQAIAPAPTAGAGMQPAPAPTTSQPRRTLTDADRRRMCIYHEENPNVKQTEIGAMFGVERSTVSKVLRQKEKYLFPDDGSRSPVKRSKGKFPDIERALSVWAKNTRKQGITLTDVMIREKARFFATSLGISDSHFKANNAGWLEKFKHKNNVTSNGRGRSESDVTGISRGSMASPRIRHTRHESVSDLTDRDHGSPLMKQSKSQDSNTTGSPDSFMPIDFGSGYKGFHQSANFLPGPTSPSSPFFSPDTRIDSPGFRIPSQQRPRSQTFPLLPLDGTYISPPPSSEPLTPKLPLHPSSKSPADITSSSITQGNHQVQVASPMSTTQDAPGTPSGVPPTKDDAKKALEVVISFLRQQPMGFVEQDEYQVVGKLLERFGIGEKVGVDS